MTSVYSTRELRPVPKLLVEMVKDPSSLSVVYHGRRGKEGGGEREGQREGAWKGEDPRQPITDSVCTQGTIVTTPLMKIPYTVYSVPIPTLPPPVPHSTSVSRLPA